MFIRRLPKFEYHTVSSVAEALKLLKTYGTKARVLAGGTDLLLAMKKRAVTPEHLINIKNIKALKGISYNEKKGLKIGALVTCADLEESSLVREKAPALRDAALVMASPQVKTLATIGGNICSAVPSADTAPPLIVMGAQAVLIGPKGERTVPVEKLFKGPAETRVARNEILAYIQIPKQPVNSCAAYLKLMRRAALDLALVGAAAYICLDKDNKTCKEVRIALGAVAPTPIRAPMAEELLTGKEITESVVDEAGKVAGTICSPISDVRASLGYRCDMVEVFTRRAVMEAFRRITNGTR
ncbi:MAG TPA: xanthine dehydrogenase family protein subunit M [Syntrophorhabdales bacterium]|nr:xanthine dehydrogenase family protein subunit M [Syntrophorhabdales bacterium]